MHIGQLDTVVYGQYSLYRHKAMARERLACTNELGGDVCFNVSAGRLLVTGPLS